MSSTHATGDTEKQATSHREKTTNPRDVLDAFDTIWTLTHDENIAMGNLLC